MVKIEKKSEQQKGITFIGIDRLYIIINVVVIIIIIKLK